MGLLEQKKQIDEEQNRLDKILHFRRGSDLLAYIGDSGNLEFILQHSFSKEESVELCKWYLSIYDQL